MSILHKEDKQLPPRVKFSLVQSCFYGWMTDKRFKSFPIRPCVFGCSCEQDDFYHYAVCPCLWDAYHSIGLPRRRTSDDSLRHFLLLEGDCEIPLRAAFLYAAMNAVHRLRGPSAHLLLDSRKRFVREIFKPLVSSEPFLRSAFNGIWCDHGFHL